MTIAFASNLTMTVFGGGSATVLTDPVPLGGNDRATAIANVHDIQTNSVTGASQLVYFAQVSTDGGQEYRDASAITDILTMVGLTRSFGAVNGALLRFKFVFSNPSGGGTDVSAVCFDLHVKLDHV